MSIFLFLFCVFWATFFATRLVRGHALRHRILDIPGERSSHTAPTPRGGGIGFAVVILLGGAVLFGCGEISINVFVALLGGGAAVAGIGWMDDRRPLSAKLRFAVHCFAAAWAVYWTGAEGWGETAFFFLATAWLINLYNFMDGIDGLAAATAVAAGAAGAFLCGGSTAALCAVTAAAAGGFLRWNWPPAKIFMGDAGSGFFGYVFAVAWLAGAAEGGADLYTVPILLAVFLTDATLTLLWRAARGEKWYAAHRLHAYQTLAARHGHRAVTIAAVAFQLLWLAPMAAAATAFPDAALPLAAAAYFPPAALVIFIHAKKTVFPPRNKRL